MESRSEGRSEAREPRDTRDWRDARDGREGSRPRTSFGSVGFGGSPLPSPGQRFHSSVPKINTVDRFDIGDGVGAGTYSHVFKCKTDRFNGDVVLKKIEIATDRNGAFPWALREVSVLSRLRHPNIIRLVDVALAGDERDPKKVWLVFDSMDYNLGDLINESSFTRFEQVRYITKQILEGIDFCHSQGIMHRDIKPANILINTHGCVKISDFGLACAANEVKLEHTTMVVTRWYRAPELVLGIKRYGVGIDIWSVGCVMAEMIIKNPLFKGMSDADQLGVILKLCDLPDDTFAVSLGGVANNFIQARKSNIQKHIEKESKIDDVHQSDYELLAGLLQIDPTIRMTSKQALQHPTLSELTHERMDIIRRNLPTCAMTSEHVSWRFGRQSELAMKGQESRQAGANGAGAAPSSQRNGSAGGTQHRQSILKEESKSKRFCS